MPEETEQLTLIATLAQLPAAISDLPERYTSRETRPTDVRPLADLYFASYPRDIVATESAAHQEIRLTVAGEYGELDLDASPLILSGDDLVASVMTVRRAPWDDTPPGPFFIEVIVHPSHRRRGLARFAVLKAASILKAHGKQTVGLRVLSNNEGALAMYYALGFQRWSN